jgi:AcrR family transcriptional regulator
MAPQRRRRERGSISVDEIINGAFEMAAEVSIDNLSMPLLARHLDVGVTSIYWYFRKKDELLDAMTDRALAQYEFTVPDIDASNWRESLRNHAQTMRKQFLADPVLCDLVLIRGHYGMPALHGALHEIERPIAALVEAGLTPEQAVETYGAISVHSRGSVVLQRLQQKTDGFPSQRGDGNRYIGFADDIDFDYILDSILDHAQELISPSTASP